MKLIARTLAMLALLLVIVYVAVSYLVAVGVTKAERIEQEDHPSNYGLAFEEVSFPSRQGNVTLDGWHIPGDDGMPSLVFVHGIGGTRSADMLTGLASRLNARGFSVLQFDLRAHGNSGGEQVSGGYFERYDLLGAFDYLVRRGVPASRIGVLGVSMGAGSSVLGVSEELAIRALVVDSSYAKVTELIAAEIDRKTPVPEWLAPVFLPGVTTLARLLYNIDINALVPEEAVQKLDYPVLVIHGTADTRIPAAHGVRLFKAAPRGSELWLVEDVEHVDAFLDFPSEYEERVSAYFSRRLGGQ